jgi:hypothetical protein
VLRAAGSVKGLSVRPEIVQEARQACAELRLTGKARKRAPRPTPASGKEIEQQACRYGNHRAPLNSIRKR